MCKGQRDFVVIVLQGVYLANVMFRNNTPKEVVLKIINALYCTRSGSTNITKMIKWFTLSIFVRRLDKEIILMCIN